MKKNFVMALLCLFAVSCSNETIESDNAVINAEKATVPVTVRVSGFSITMERIPSEGGTMRAAESADSYADAKAIVLAFYSGNTEVYKTAQYKADPSTYTTFGEFTCNLPVGDYTMVAIAYNHFAGDEFTLTSPTVAAYTSQRPRETFAKTQAVTVASATPLELNVTLNRINAHLNIVSTDGRTAEATKIKTTYSKAGKGFNPTTGLATSDTGFWVTNSPSASVGSTIDIYSCAFLATDEELVDVTIQALDADDNVLVTKFVPNVPLQRNRKTKLTGTVYTGGSASSSFQLETTWLDETDISF